MKLRLPAPVTKSVPEATKVPALHRKPQIAKVLCHEACGLRKRWPVTKTRTPTSCACHNTCASSCERAAPVRKTVPQVASTLRLQRHLRFKFENENMRTARSQNTRRGTARAAQTALYSLSGSESRPECAEGSFCALKMLTAPFSLTSSVWSSFNMYPAPGRARFDLHKFLRLPRNLHPSSKVLCPPWNSIQRLPGIGPVPQSAC